MDKFQVRMPIPYNFVDISPYVHYLNSEYNQGNAGIFFIEFTQSFFYVSSTMTKDLSPASILYHNQGNSHFIYYISMFFKAWIY